MQFINLLVIAVAVLTILAALALVFGTNKSERVHSLWFLGAAIGEVIWAVSIAVFLSLEPNDANYEIAPWLVRGIYSGALIMDAALLFYISWKQKYGGVISTFFLIASVVFITLLFVNPELLYTGIQLKEIGNSVTINTGTPFYISYVIFFVALNSIIFVYLFSKIRNTSNKKTRRGYLFFLIGLMATGALSGIFDLILPLSRYDLIWVGPITIGLTILGFYFAILKYKLVSINVGWLKVLSSIVIISGAFLAYLLIFQIVFSALFRTANPSFQVILLNFVMVAIVLCLVPAISEMMSLTKSMMMTRQIDIAYIVKKLSTVDPKKSNFKEISSFLAEHTHFSYVGFIVKDKLYVADECNIPQDVVNRIVKLPVPVHGAWQDVSRLGENVLKDFEISRVGVMVGANGDVAGQMVFGKPVSRANLEHKELVELAIIVSLMGTLIEDGRRKS